MTATVSPTNNVGIISIAICIYCIILCGIQFFMKHEASKLLIGLSSGSLLLMSCASGFIALTYYAPRLWSNDITTCHCHPLWAAALISYISSIYLLKAVYVTRVHLLSKGSVLGTPETKKGIKITIISLVISSIACFLLMIFMTYGDCHDDLNHRGCIADFHLADIYIAMAMIVFDAILFAGFCYKWYKIMHIFKMSEQDHKIPTKVIQTFIIQFFLTITAMASCFFDGVIHLLIHNDGYNYHITMLVFLFDCTVVATCNFCMISESQLIIKKLLCFCCPSPQNRPTLRQTPSLGYLSSNSVPRRRGVLSNTTSNTVSTTNNGNKHRLEKPGLVLSHTISNQSHLPPVAPGFGPKISDFEPFDGSDIHSISKKVEMSTPTLTIQPTNSSPVSNSNEKLSVDEIKEIRAEIAECVRRGSVVIVYNSNDETNSTENQNVDPSPNQLSTETDADNVSDEEP